MITVLMVEIYEYHQWLINFQSWTSPGANAIVPDALSQRPDYLSVINERETEGHIEYVKCMEKYLSNGALPKNEFDELIVAEAPMDDVGCLWRKIREGVTAPCFKATSFNGYTVSMVICR
jgi:hypothetical protein